MADVSTNSDVMDKSNLTNGSTTDPADDDGTFGVSSGKIPDNALFSSSALNAACGANQARLHQQPIREKYGAWSPLFKDKDQYLDVDLGELVQVGAIATQGRPGFTEDGGWFVQSYTIAAGTDGENFTNLREYGISKVFEGNTDPEAVVKNTFKTALKCRYLRIKPVTWHNQISLRVEIYKFTGTANNSRKRSNPPKAQVKATSDRTKSRPGVRSTITMTAATTGQDALRAQEPKVSNVVVGEAKGMGDAQHAEEMNKEDGPLLDVIATNQAESNGVVSPQESFEVIDIANNNLAKEKKVNGQTEQRQKELTTKEPKSVDDTKELLGQIGEERSSESVRAQAGEFEGRSAVNNRAYSLKMKQASAVSTNNDGTKYIGRIKLIKKEQPLFEDEVDAGKEEKGVLDCEIPQVVKQRLTDYDVEVRAKDPKTNNASKRRSVLLEEDLSYLDQMEVSMHERLKMFKETETKKLEDLELTKHEEEKRLTLKRDAEKRRSVALQKEQERMLALIEKQKEEEEVRRQEREKSEAEANEEFVEIDAADAEVPPAIVHDRLKLFKESEKEGKETQEMLKLEAEKRRSAKDMAEKKRQQAEQREKERLQELIRLKQEQEALRVQHEDSKRDVAAQESMPGDQVPAIVNDRVRLFKEGEKAEQERKEALRIEAMKKKTAKEESERRKIIAIKDKNKVTNQTTSNEGTTRKKMVESRSEEEEIIEVQDSGMVESAISFDFMENGEEVTQDYEVEDTSPKQGLGKVSDDEKQRIREAKQKFMQIENTPVDPKALGARKVGKLRSEEKTIQPVERLVQVEDDQEVKESISEEESLDLQERLQGIDTHHEGYDPDQERRMLEEAEAAFRSFAVHQKSDAKPKRSAKTAGLIKSFSVASSSPSNQPKGRENEKTAVSTNVKVISRPSLVSSQSFDEEVIVAEAEQGVCSMPEDNQQQPERQMPEQDSDIINAGLVKQRANLFASPAPPAASGIAPNASVKKWLASSHPAASPRDRGMGNETERSVLVRQIENIEKRVAGLSAQIEQLKVEDKEEEVLNVEEEFHAAQLELTKAKRQLAKIHKDAGVDTRRSSSGSECHSTPEDASCDRASSTGSRASRGGSAKPSRELKSPLLEKPRPHVDTSAFNDDGEVVPEGNVISQIQTYEHESTRQRKEMAEIRKSLSLSRSFDATENPPPTGFGGAEFARDKSKLSRECKLPRGTPVPPVEYNAFNEDGDCVQEGNVLQQVQAFSKD